MAHRRPAPPSSHAPPTYWHSEMPADSTPPAISFPAVEHDSGQKHGEDIHAFMKRRRLHNEKQAQHETSEAKGRRLAQENHAVKGGPPGKKGARAFIWEEEEGGFFIRCTCNRTDAAERWDEFTSNQRIYDYFSNQWDLCTALAPNEEAEPDEMYDDDDDYDDSYMRTTYRGGECKTFCPPSSTVFGFEEPVAPISSSREMERKACAWAVGDETYTVPDASNVNVEIISQQTRNSIRFVPAVLKLPVPRFYWRALPPSFKSLGWAGGMISRISSANLWNWVWSFIPAGRDRLIMCLSLPHLSTLWVAAPAGYKPTFVDFGVYVQRRNTFLRSPRGRVALFYGGIIGRLARSAIPDFADIAYLDPSEDILKTGAHVLSGNREEALWHEALTPDEINLICGVYSVETGMTKEQQGRRRTAIEVYLLMANPDRLLVIRA
ncbi:hypothetical protein B0H14DRAFT_2646762 [Mycena olivaceomarginata]|nr:hypothetical protein B0H14DRAFT_2646762 [Mycena olivaceomarginata]